MDHHQTLKITLQYANDLHKVNLISKMNIYAVVSISGGQDKSSMHKIKTPVDNDGGNNPAWGFPMNFIVEEAALHQNRLFLNFKLICKRALGDKHVGDVHVPVKELVDSPPAKGGNAKFVTYQVRKPSGKPKGQLTFSYQFIGESTISGEVPPSSPVVKPHGRAGTVYPVGYPPAGYYPLPAGGPALGVYYVMRPGFCRPPAPVGYSYPAEAAVVHQTIGGLLYGDMIWF
ncbi:hypothetical protein CASFOL_012793 [Castilleja foliolosa]|uniref:C2 domain-containing protein n=1 Tax=Castilleja foliolosa TaxID=1961234 RepID=A0ABD3DI82_9LAMI